MDDRETELLNKHHLAFIDVKSKDDAKLKDDAESKHDAESKGDVNVQRGITVEPYRYILRYNEAAFRCVAVNDEEVNEYVKKNPNAPIVSKVEKAT